MTSDEIVNALKVKHKRDFVLTETKSGPTHNNKSLYKLDLWAMKLSWKEHSIGYEIKVSRSDFVSDTKWPNYLQFCNQFYWACPTGLIKPDEIDPTVGLIYINDDGQCRTVKKALFRNVDIPTDFYRYIIMWRLMTVQSAPVLTKAQRISKYIENKLCNAELGKEFKSKLINENKRLEKEVSRLNIKLYMWKDIIDKYTPYNVNKKMQESNESVDLQFLIKLKDMIDKEILIKSR